ncbi:hypothetical protein CAPTEDRAFT_154522 [Capitella teleta]|uniref:NOC3-like protein n=1 Tax=Capitella teleta TaxID=283909 RepID=R7UED6_CAPTE|nr:hypothetical protein CAPTEDRAFT_154522 [Capitella teleta]|eukprot:ELU04426.1 hypothetical protein CAPTEDRAFT_154522 [Capitella teleta]
MTTAQLFVYRKEKLAICKRRLALLADTIMEDPESNMSKLKEMRMMLDESDPLIALSVKKLTAFSLLEVFKDILPDYRIRVATDKEKEGQAKKETKKLREFEEGILANYKAYLDFLDNIVKACMLHNLHSQSPCNYFWSLLTEQQLVMVALKCLCELMVAHPHFNFRTNIIALVIPFACKFNPELSNLVCEYVRKIFKSDKSGESSLEIARLIGRVVKVTKFRVSERVLETFLSLKIKEINKEHMSKQDAAKKRDAIRRMSRKDKKDKKHMIHLEKELEDVALEKSREQRVKLHTQIVSIIFLTYFRILKFARNSKLLSTVLAGLAKFAHFINVDFFDDLFSVLKELVISGTLTNTESLNCIQTAFTILSGQGSALNIDPLMFYTHLYNVLLRLNASESSQDVSIALECLDIMFNQRRKQVSMPRTLAFMKRLGILSLQMQSNGALGMLAAVRNILLNIPRSEVLLDTECEGSGSYMPDLDEPEYCNAHNTALYELHAMRRHYHPVVRQYSDHVLGGAPSEGRRALNLDLSRKAATELFQKYDASDMTFTPVISEKPKQIKQKGPMYPQGVFPEFKLDSERIQASLTDADFDDVDFSSYKKRRKTQS